MMCDIKGKGQVFQEDYKKFCFEFLGMYEELTQMKTRINDLEADVVNDFERIVNVLGGVPKTDKQGNKFFDREDFDQALIEYPELFAWIENPENYFNEMTKMNAKKQQLKTISLEDFENYHRDVMESYDRMMEMVQNQFGEHFNHEEISAFRRRNKNVSVQLRSQVTILDRFSKKNDNMSPDRNNSVKRIMTKAESTTGKLLYEQDSIDKIEELIAEESC